ncbi:Nucleic-acid-binding protein from transposon X-element [Eumeta japonica]|uniref:Nucleic-acid-binding protein from transposon X-element n=1 Tax=Eumeta variegata TaxID=151549 RepID=A0A4C1SLP2_EUMVA|nr:Nucleic-acid-binding protein from transposon X-element [Eumeta japonica]
MSISLCVVLQNLLKPAHVFYDIDKFYPTYAKNIFNAPFDLCLSWVGLLPCCSPKGAVDDGGVKAAAPRPRNNRGDEADVPLHRRVAKPPPMFVQDKDPVDRAAQKVRKRHATSQARNSAQGLKEIPVDEVRKTSLPKPSGSVGAPNTEPIPQALDLVLVSGTAEANDKATKAAFFKIRSVCSLSGVKAEQPRKRALPGQCHNCQSYGHSSRHCYHSARCVKCLGDHGTAQCTRNKDTDGPPACVLCKQKGHTANYLGCPRAPKRPPPPEKAVPRRAPRLHSVPSGGWTA